MGSPLTALLWELWRTSRFEILIRIGGQSSFIVLFCSLAPLNQSTSTEAYANILRGIALMILAMPSIFSATWLNGLENRQIGFSFRLGFTRPISTTQLVVVPLLYSVVIAVTCYLLPTLLVASLLDMSMPLLGPAALVACVVTCLIAAVWCPTTIFGRGISLAAMGSAMVVTVAVFDWLRDDPDPILLALGKPEYFDFSGQTYLILAALGAIASVMTVVGVDRQRHGDASPLEGLGRWWRSRRDSEDGRTSARSTTAAASTAKPFTSSVAAQCWYETRRFGQTLLLVGVLSPLLPLAFVCIVPWVDAGWDASPVVWILALVFCPIAYQLVGVDGAIGLKRNQGTVQFPVFDATRAMPNDQLVAIKLLVIAGYSLFGWLCMGLVAGLHTIVAGDWQAWSRIGDAVTGLVGDVPVYWWIAALSNFVLLYVSSCCVLLAFGLWLPRHRVIFTCGAATLYGHMLLAALDVATDWDFRYLWTAYGYLIPIAIVCGCVVALRKALSAGLLGKRFFAGAFCLWVIYVASTIAVYIKLAPATSLPPVAILLVGSGLLVPLAATAFAPLALASHRHR